MTLEMFGCQIFVSNFIFGGWKGYSFGIVMLTMKVPPSYGVSGGPLKIPFNDVISAGSKSSKVTPECVSF